MKWISDTYNQPEIIVTENGYHDDGTVIHDLETRGRYHKVSTCNLYKMSSEPNISLQLYLSNLQDALYEDGVKLTGYMAWALTDDFEWQYGYK